MLLSQLFLMLMKLEFLRNGEGTLNRKHVMSMSMLLGELVE